MTKKRTLVSGKEVPDLGRVVNLSILTKCPEKWKIVDMETGQEYIGQKPIGGEKQVVHWKKIDG